jgi:catechol 2,3-dioxygenase-like lactoylglutathione lyase family enzyme
VAQSLVQVALLVREYDEAVAYYTRVLGFDLLEDTALSATKCWVVVAPPGGAGMRLLLARASGGRQEARIGDQAGGRVFLFLRTDDFDRDHAAYLERGVSFTEAPRDEPYGRVAVFEDLYGNRWDLVGPARPAA